MQKTHRQITAAIHREKRKRKMQQTQNVTIGDNNISDMRCIHLEIGNS